ncbi:MAG: TetR/AcrR family transcriptional regulator [Chloroflexi bacterium]|nr:TetR/AcrR family transcriptional regulator [Chloroflexota bacterium]
METALTKGEKSSQVILQAAFNLFVEQGYHGTSMRQIAQRADIALGGIYNHFSSKEDIFTEVFLNFHPVHELIVELEDVERESVAEAVRLTGHAIQQKLVGQGDFIKLIFVEIVEFRAKHFPVLFKSLFPKAIAIAQGVFSARGKLRPYELPVMVFGFFGIMFGYFFVRAISRESDFLDGGLPDLDKLIDIFLYGILDEKPEGGTS